MDDIHPDVALYLEADRDLAHQYQLATRDLKSRKQDRLLWYRFSNFLGSKDPWKADGEDAAAWCAYCADSGLSAHTVETFMSNLNFVFEQLGKGHFIGDTGKGTRQFSPFREPMVRETMKGIRYLHPEIIKPVRPLTLEHLDALIDQQPDSIAGIRNRAFFSLMWAGAMRGAEVISLDISYEPGTKGFVEFRPNGLAILLLQSKSHRLRKQPEVYGIPKRTSFPEHCPVKLLLEWLQISRLSHGPLFPAVKYIRAREGRRTKRHTLMLAFRRSLLKCSLAAEEYGMRSFRSGCINWLASQGVGLKETEKHTGHANSATIYPYLRGSTSIEASPLNRTSWVG